MLQQVYKKVTSNLRFKNIATYRRKLFVSHDVMYINRFSQQIRCKKDKPIISTLFAPVQIKPNSDDINVGAELTGTINKAELVKILNKFYQTKEIKALLSENGLDSEYYFMVSIFLLIIFYYNRIKRFH